jgi:putative ABC transport system ATP-binding protein
VTSREAEVLRLSGVGKDFVRGEVRVRALRDVDLALRAGELVAITGPSGAGKTTLLEILGCLSRPTHGQLHVDGRRADRLGARQLARLRGETIGFVFQRFNLLPRLTALENVELPMTYRGVRPAERRRRAREGLERVGLGHRLGHLPPMLSGGECQRVAIARSLVNEPRLLLADEPTGNLDSRTGREILELLLGIHRAGRTVVLVTHDPGIAARCPREIRVCDGRVEDAA